ncbi:MAG: hypothetical protein RBU21_01665 [FCB group bacterium]|jgi:hypothetical protein|nr:hypothetical protein [FCB group bacterium]
MRRICAIAVLIALGSAASGQLSPAREEALRAVARGEAVAWPAAGAKEARLLHEKAEGYLANLQEHHLPNGLAVGILWEDDTRAKVLAYGGVDDGAGRQGRYLAVLAFKYAVRHDEETLEEILKVLAAFDLLITISGREGYLVRYAGPASDEHYRDIYKTYPRGEDPREKGLGKAAHKGAGPRDHMVWLGATSPGIYDGAALGLAAALKYVDAPEAQRRTRQILRRMGKRLAEDGWNIEDNRGRRTHTSIAWRLVWMRLLMSADPALYEHLARDYRALFDKLMERKDTLRPVDKYAEDYANNIIDFDRYFVLFALETDPDRKRTYGELLRENYERAGDHLNPHLAAVYLLAKGNPDKANARATLEGMLLDFPAPPYRLRAVDRRENELIEMAGPGTSEFALLARERIPSEALWSQPPCRAVGGEEKNLEFTGLDYLLPYWMARLAGVLDFM